MLGSRKHCTKQIKTMVMLQKIFFFFGVLPFKEQSTPTKMIVASKTKYMSISELIPLTDPAYGFHKFL